MEIRTTKTIQGFVMRKVKVLQLASFEGNIGDNANHNGTRKLLKKNLNFSLEFTDLEIREYFWGIRKFDNSFANLANKYDLLIVGGGNFFELWVDHSCNNTSIDIDISILEKIKTPTIFYALGMDPGMGVSKKGIEKFKKWLDYVIEHDRFILSLRNDGSYETAEKYLGDNYSKHFYKVPDGGFFTEVKNYYHIEIPTDATIIGLNLAGDMLDIRFPNNIHKGISYEQFIINLGILFNNLFEKIEILHLVLFPHIYKDLEVIYKFLSKLDDKFARRRVTVAPYIHGFDAQSYIFDAYSKCDVILGNRFHSNVCGIGLNIPTIGLINYRQIEKLYAEHCISERAIFVNKKGFEIHLNKLIIETLKNSSIIKKKYKNIFSALEEQENNFHKIINNWLVSL